MFGSGAAGARSRAGGLAAVGAASARGGAPCPVPAPVPPPRRPIPAAPAALPLARGLLGRGRIGRRLGGLGRRRLVLRLLDSGSSSSSGSSRSEAWRNALFS